MPLLIPVITIFMLLMIAPCIINCLPRFVFAQVNKLQHVVLVQRGCIKPHPTMGNITHPQRDSAIRTLRLETSKKGRPNALPRPNTARSSQGYLDGPIPKDLGLPSVEGGILGSQNRKKDSKMLVAKRQRKGKSSENGTKESPWTRVRNSGETNTSPSWLAQFAQGELKREETKYIKR